MHPCRTAAFAGTIAVLAAAASSGPAAVSACPRLSDAASLPPVGREFAGDLDGDRHHERVLLVADRAAPARCGLFLVVQDGRSTSAARVPAAGPGSTAGTLRLDVPRVAGLFRIDRSRRLDVVVQVVREPGSAEYAVYRLRRGRLFRPPIEGAPRNRLLWSRRASARAAFDCDASGSGRLTQHRADLQASGAWDVRGATYRSRETVFAEIFAFTVVVDAAEAAARFASWPARPLGTCR